MPLTILKIAVLAPIPSASVNAATEVNPKLLRNCRIPKRISCINPVIASFLHLLVAQSSHRIDAGGAPGWYRCSNRSHRSQYDNDGDERGWIGALKAE